MGSFYNNAQLVDISRIELFVLDEADRMLDIGFIHDAKRVIAKLPAQRQSLFFFGYYAAAHYAIGKYYTYQTYKG